MYILRSKFTQLAEVASGTSYEVDGALTSILTLSLPRLSHFLALPLSPSQTLSLNTAFFSLSSFYPDPHISCSLSSSSSSSS